MKVKSLLLASAVLASVPIMASAEPSESWYLGVGVGPNWLDDVEGNIVGFGSPPIEIGFDNGWAVTGHVGYGWDMIRVELELAYRENEADFYRNSGFTVLGDDTQFSQMLNLLIDLPLGDSVELSLGGGLGGVQMNVNITAFTFPGETTIIAGDDYVFAYQGIAGLSIDVGERTELFGQYQYFATEEADIGGMALPSGVTFGTRGFDARKHTALIGLRYYFGESAAAAEDAPPPIAPPPPSALVVMFDFNKANLTADGQAAVVEAAEAHKGGAGTVTIEVQGDGDPARDQELSERRGAAVKAALVDMGVPADKITVETREGGDAIVTVVQ